jgi:carboxyl-terminal processing protease
MSHALPTLRAFAAIGLLLAGSASLAVSPPALTEDEAIASLQNAYVRAVKPGEQADLHRELFAPVLQRVKRSSAKEVDLAAFAEIAGKAMAPLPAGTGDPAEIFKKAINEALRSVDPHSRYFDARGLENQRGESTGVFVGLGIEVQAGEGAVRVVAPIPGSPAARAGLVSGDLIVRVDDQPLVGVALADAIARMRGPVGTPVSITIQRVGAPQEFTLSITRDTIRRQLLQSSMEGDVLVLRLSSFSGPASAAIEKAIARATAERQPRAVVLDVRGNPGGLLVEAVKVADTFLNAGDIVSVRSPVRTRTWHADPNELLAGLPMVVLIDGRSASASELVADALQHSGRATVMGQRSVGKGSVQMTFPLGDQKGAVKLTTAIYHGPSGETLHHAGVAPDIELLAAGKTEAASNASPSSAKARVDAGRCAAPKASDPALSCALAYLRAGSVDAFVAKLAGAAP